MDKSKSRHDAKIDARIGEILKNTMEKIRPDIKVLADADDMVAKINDRLRKDHISAECVKGGSIAKGTFLKDDYDIDLFIRFNQSYEDDKLSDLAETVLKQLCESLKARLDRVHGSRDYFQFDLQKGRKILKFEVIPVRLVHAQDYMDARNITDLSPEHVNWVSKHTKNNPALMDEIRLAKQFCKASKTYGAESYINGFSGHILDIMIIHYGSFLTMLRAFSKFHDDDLKKPIIIDVEGHLADPLKQLNKSKITPLIIVDPIQRDRNSAAALSKDRLSAFIKAAKGFLENPDKGFFEIKDYDIEAEISGSLKSIGMPPKDTYVARIEMEITEGSKDISGTKALKAYEAIVEHLKLNDFKVLKSDWNFRYDDRSAQAYIIVDRKISKDFIQEGPPSSAAADYQRFLEKHSSLGHKIKIKDGRPYAIYPRKYIDPISLINDLAGRDFISKKVKRIFAR